MNKRFFYLTSFPLLIISMKPGSSQLLTEDEPVRGPPQPRIRVPHERVQGQEHHQLRVQVRGRQVPDAGQLRASSPQRGLEEAGSRDPSQEPGPVWLMLELLHHRRPRGHAPPRHRQARQPLRAESHRLQQKIRKQRKHFSVTISVLVQVNPRVVTVV